MILKIEITVEASPHGFMAEAWTVLPSRQMILAERDYATPQAALRHLLADLQKDGWGVPGSVVQKFMAGEGSSRRNPGDHSGIERAHCNTEVQS